jgi:hypothetical protein
MASYYPTPASGQRHSQLTAAHTAGYLGAVCAAVHHWVALLSSPQPLSVDRPPTVPIHQQATDYTFLLRSLSELPQCRHTLSAVVAASLSSTLLSQSVVYQQGRKGAAAPQKSRVCASLRSLPPLSLRNGQALDFFHPACNKALIGLSPKALSFYFLFS